MYNEYYGFVYSPFEDNLDQKFLYLSEDHKEVLAALLYFVKAKKSFALVCGDVGTGKTMLINYFLNRLPESIQPVIISSPFVNSQDLLIYLSKILHIELGGSEGILELLDKVKNALIATKDQHRQLVLIVDEAHLLSDQALEEIRLISNLETPEQKLLQILLVGQYELSYKLDRPEMRHLRQRINVNRFLSHLTSEETLQYIDHRLKQVRSSFAAVFQPDCQNLIFKMTRGLPRRVNQICDNALLISMAEGVSKVNPKILKKAKESTQTDLIFTPRSSKGRFGRFKRLFGFWCAISAIAAVLVLGMILINAGLFIKKGGHISYKDSGLVDTSPETMADSLELPKPEVSPPTMPAPSPPVPNPPPPATPQPQALAPPLPPPIPQPMVVPPETPQVEQRSTAKPEAAEKAPEPVIFVANPGGKSYHLPSSPWVKNTPTNQLLKFSSAAEAEKAGLHPGRDVRQIKGLIK